MSHQGISKSTRGFIMRTVRRGYLSRNLGFTTIELLVTVGIMATVAAISVPIFKNFSPSYNSKQAARNIVSQMQLARVHAIRNRVTTVVARSEEHTSELQSRGLISYAVFCLKKKKKTK